MGPDGVPPLFRGRTTARVTAGDDRTDEVEELCPLSQHPDGQHQDAWFSGRDCLWCKAPAETYDDEPSEDAEDVV